MPQKVETGIVLRTFLESYHFNPSPLLVSIETFVALVIRAVD